jgi:hypothetical protein
MDKALATQLTNIEKRTGRTLDELARIVKDSGLTKHGEVRVMLKHALGMGHGDANALVHYVFKSAPAFAPPVAGGADAEVDRIYSGPKAALRPIHDKVMAAIEPFGPFDIAPKKTYLSLRRRKQFAMLQTRACRGRLKPAAPRGARSPDPRIARCLEIPDSRFQISRFTPQRPVTLPMPQSARPGRAPVCSPSRSTCPPLTNTCRTPTDN